MLERISRSYVPNGTMSNDDDDDDDDDDCDEDDDYDDKEYFSLNIEPTLKSVTVEKNTVINKNRLSFPFCCCVTVCFVIFSRRL